MLVPSCTSRYTPFSFIAVKLKLADLPEGTNWLQMLGVAFLGGVGFTMALFISNLAFEGELIREAKIGILLASLIAGLIGFFILKRSLKSNDA